MVRRNARLDRESMLHGAARIYFNAPYIGVQCLGEDRPIDRILIRRVNIVFSADVVQEQTRAEPVVADRAARESW